MKKLLIMAASVAAMVSCAKNPFFEQWNTPYGIPPFDQIKEAHYLPAIKEGIRQHNEEIEAIVSNPEAPTFDNTLLALDRSGQLLTKVSLVLFTLCESDATDSLNEIVLEAMGLVSLHESEVSTNEALFKRVEAVHSNMEGLTREQQMIVEKEYRGFIQGGVGLEGEAKERMKAINARLSELQQTFGNNILAANNSFELVVSEPEEIAGLPEAALEAAKGEDGKYHFYLTNASYTAFMTYADNRDLREQMFRAYSNRCNGGEFDNNRNILEIMALRVEKAHLLGYNTPADMILTNTMAGKSEAVDTFLESIMAPAVKMAKKEIALMQQMTSEKIQPWDLFYYAEKIRQRDYALSEDDTKPYFKMENVRAGVFSTASKLYGIQFEKLEDAPVYYSEVEAFKVMDADGSLLGILLTDYYPRSTKRGGAWMTEFTAACGYEGIRPVIVNVGNFTKPTATKPSLLTIDEVETMFHEFGHALHGLLTQTTYRSDAGTSVKRDFVELPSQFNENWAFQKEVLATYALHYETGEVIPDELIAKIDASSNFFQGFATTELTAASILDMKWHEISEAPDYASMDADAAKAYVEAFEANAMKEAGLIGEIIPRYRSTYFNHVFNNGYSAGYYSYLWAEVLDKDAFEVFKQKGLFDQESAKSFRENILEKGSSEEPMVLYHNFRGADPNPDALLKARGLK